MIDSDADKAALEIQRDDEDDPEEVEYRRLRAGDFFAAGDRDFCGERRLTGERDLLAGERRAGDLERRAGDLDRRAGDRERLAADLERRLRGGDHLRGGVRPRRPNLGGDRTLSPNRLLGELFRTRVRSLGMRTNETATT